MLFWSVPAGALGTLVTIGFRSALFELDRLVLGQGGGLVAVAMQLQAWQRILVPSLGGLLAGALLTWAQNRTPQNAPSDYMEAVALGNGHIPVQASLVRSGSSLLSIASGGSIGREGSMVQLAALGASLLVAYCTSAQLGVVNKSSLLSTYVRLSE